MPWLIDGTFERILPDYPATSLGVLWGQDLTASVKIVASRHDYHDQDIADGIASALNLDGYNTMRANLNMGGYKIEGIGAATILTDIPQYGQCAGSFDYTPGTGVLILFDRNGDEIDQVTLTPGTGGSGTVTSITTDDTLVSAPNTITETGVLGLKAIGVGQSYTGGIQGIVIDDYGRVTQVTIGGSSNTDLGKVQGDDFVQITSSTGTNTIIGDATGARAGVMSIAQHNQLDQASSDISVNQSSISALQGDTVDLNSDQSIGGIKTFSEQLFAAGGMTTDGEVRMLNLPTSLGATSQIGDLYIDGEFIKIRIV